jgi:peroxiredoxin Q/BCP
LLSDSGKQTARAYGVLRAMGLYAARHTFYIGVDGKILHVDTNVNPDTAGEDLVERLGSLGVRRR